MYWVLYDITNTRKRNQVVRLCKDFGLQRVQKSCFAGDMLSKRLVIFQESVAKVIGKEDSVIVAPMPDSMMEKVVIVGKGKLPEPTERENILFL